MTPYTDAALTIHIIGADLSTAREIRVTMAQGRKSIDTTDVTATGDGEGGCYLAVSFTQTQTGVFDNGADILMQPNWVDASGNRPNPPEPAVIRVGTQLYRKVMNGAS